MHIRGPMLPSTYIQAWLWIGLACLLSTPGRVLAEPMLRVRAQVALELRVTGKEPGLRVEGSLADDLGARLAQRSLHVAFRGPGTATLAPSIRNRNIRTDARGQFALDAPCVGCSVLVEFPADAYYEHASVSQIVAVPRPTLSLDFLEPSQLEVSLDQPSVNLVVRASGPARVGDVAIELQNELARTIGQGKTGSDGVLRLQVESSALGPYGLGEIVARLPATLDHAAARASKAILRTVQTHTDLQAKLDAKTRSLKVSLQLQAQSQPVVQRAVGVYLDKQHISTLITDEHGFASATLALDDARLSVGKHRVHASFQSDIPGLLSSESPVQSIELVAPARPSSAWLILPVLASIAFVLWSARRKPAHAKRAEITALAEPEVRMGEEARGRSVTLHTISGRVEDVDTGNPLLAAIELSTGEQLVHTLQTSAEGWFESGVLAAGEYQARVVAPGYAGISFTFTLPHHGACSNMQISARSLRVLALDTYGSFAARVLPDARVRGKTVRETLAAAVGGGKVTPMVTELAHTTETIAYARATPYEGDLHDLQRAAANALRDAGAQAQNAGDPDLGW